MFAEPFFETDILKSIWRNLQYYLGYKDWIIYYTLVLGIFWGFVKFLTLQNSSYNYKKMFPQKEKGFDKKNKSERFGIICVVFLLSCVCLMLYGTEVSLFNNYDTMAVNTLYIFKYGVLPMFGVGGRLSPTGFWDMNIIYAVTHNFAVVNIYLLIQCGIIIWLLYRFLDFMSAGKRLFLITIIMISPQVFWSNNPAYPERMMLIYIIASMIFLKNFIRKEDAKNLWLFTLFMNLAIFCKENVALFYGGILGYLILHDIWFEKITIRSFIHPLKGFRKLPIESLILVSLLSFSLFFLIFVTSFIKDNPYILGGNQEKIPFGIYKTEIIISVIILWILIKKQVKEGFLNATSVAVVLMSLFTIGYMRVGSYPHIQTHAHYLILAVVFGLVYIFYTIKDSKHYFWLGGLLLIFFGFENIYIAKNLEGKYYAQTAEYIGSLTQKDRKINIYIPAETEKTFWRIKSFNSALKYYFPNRRITFSGNVNPNDAVMDIAHIKKDTEHYYPFEISEGPKQGDIFLLRKSSLKAKELLQSIQNKPRELIFENKVFKLYEMK